MVCQLKAGANRLGFAVLDVALSQHHLQLEMRGDHVLLHHPNATLILSSKQALHELLRQLMLLQSLGNDE